MAGSEWSASCGEAVGGLHACRRTPGADAIPRSVGDTSASAMRAMDDPMTRASWRLVSTSATPRSIIERRITSASMSRSVNMRSSGSTSGKPRARQKRRARSRSMPVISATSDWV